MERSKLKPHSAVLSNDEIDKLLTNYFKSNPVLTVATFKDCAALIPYHCWARAKSNAGKRGEEVEEYQYFYYNPIYVPMPGYMGQGRENRDEIKGNQKK